MRPATVLVLLGFFGALSILVGEVALRLIGFSHPAWNRVDPVLGLALRPYAEGWHRDEGEVYVRLNGDGLRDRWHTVAKPKHLLRIAVLGDSFAEAVQVEQHEAFWAVLERELARNCAPLDERGLQVEVLNFGVSGFGTAQELLMLRDRAWKYGPDLVLLAFLSANDMRNNLRALEKNDLKPYFLLTEDGELELDRSFLDTERYRRRATRRWKALQSLSDHSRLIQLANRVKRSLTLQRTVDENRRKLTKNADPQLAALAEIGREALEYRGVYAAPTDPLWQQAWRVTEAILTRMSEEVTERGAGFMVATLSNGIQVHPDAERQERYRELLGVEDLFYPERRIEALGQSVGFPVVALAPPLAAYANEQQVFLHGFSNSTRGEGHWNARGHGRAGELLAAPVCELLAGMPHD